MKGEIRGWVETTPRIKSEGEKKKGSEGGLRKGVWEHSAQRK